MSETSQISVVREAHAQYMMSYNYKTCINSDDTNYMECEYINVSNLIEELKNYAENITTFHGMNGMLLFLIRIFSRLNSKILNIHPQINKKLLSTPLYLPSYSPNIKMYKCSVIT
jgi:hypothetical protein